MHRVSRPFVALIVLALVTALAPIATVLAQASAAAAPVIAPAPGLIRGWGDDSRGQIGIANTIACPNPTPGTCPNPFPGLSSFGVVKVAAGDLHTVILRGDGMVWSVGDNTRAQLGQASTTPAFSSTPVRVVLNSGSTNFVDIAAGPDYGLALDEFGVVWRWGQGLNFTGNVQGLSNIVAIAAGGDAGSYHNLALDQSGTVWAWGNNESGQLGNGSFVDGGPVSVSGITNAVAIAAGARHSLALLGDGTVVAWGNNEFGQLGDGTTENRSTPVPVAGLTNITAIDAGPIDGNGAVAGTDSHSVARKSDGTVWTWGANWAGQLGNGTTNTTANATPAPVPGVTTAVGVTAGGAHTLALLADKSVSSWGANESGQLGDGSKTARSSPGAVGLTNPNAANFVEAGAAHSTVITPLGSLGEYTSMTPARFLDTRSDGVTADGQYRATGVINQGGSMDVQITGRNGVPASGVSAVVLNATVTEPTQPSFLTVWPAGFTRPTASNLNYVPGETVPNLVTVALGVGGKVSVYNHNGATHAVFDVVGYYSSVGGPDGTRVHMITPARIMDTRGLPTVDGQFQGGDSIGQNQTRDLDVTGRGGVPASNVSAIVINVTVTEPTMSSYVTAYPGDVAKPNASNLNFVPGETVPNLAIVRVPANGIVRFYNLFGNTHLVVDVVGYFDDDEADDAGRVIPLVPGRLFDTRIFGPVAPNATLSLNMSSFNAGITNSQASGYVLNTTVTEPSAAGYLTVFPGNVPRPLASNLNFVAGQTVPNLVMSKVGCSVSPTVNFYNSPFGSTHVLADAFGVITNSLKKQPVCVPVFTGEVGASEVLEVTAPSDGVANLG